MLTFEIIKRTSTLYIQWKTIGRISHKYRGSTHIAWYDNDRKHFEECLVNGSRHRDPLEGPSVTYWYENGQKCSEAYFVNGSRHRDPTVGPAITVWNSEGHKNFEEFMVDGTSTRTVKA